MLKFQSPGIHCIVSVVLYVSIPMIAYDMEEGFFSLVVAFFRVPMIVRMYVYLK